MYRPANIREMVTPAVHKKPTYSEVNGRSFKNYNVVGNLRGKFKLKGTSEKNANGLTVVNTTTTYTTWYKSDLAANDILIIGGVEYEIIGEPENVEMRGRYTILNLERTGGGA